MGCPCCRPVFSPVHVFEHPCPGDNVSIRPKGTEQVKRLCQSTVRYYPSSSGKEGIAVGCPRCRRRPVFSLVHVVNTPVLGTT